MKWRRSSLSLRTRLYLFSGGILTLFAVNVATHVWGSFARSESLIAYRDAVNAAQLITDLEQSLEDNRQQVLVLATLRETTEDPLGVANIYQRLKTKPNPYRIGEVTVIGKLSLQAFITEAHGFKDKYKNE